MTDHRERVFEMLNASGSSVVDVASELLARLDAAERERDALRAQLAESEMLLRDARIQVIDRGVSYQEIKAERDALATRRDELLVTIRNLSATVPYPEESRHAATLIAEVGTLRARVTEYADIIATEALRTGKLSAQLAEAVRERDDREARMIAALDSALIGPAAVDEDLSAEFARVVNAVRCNVVMRERAVRERDDARAAGGFQWRHQVEAATVEAIAAWIERSALLGVANYHVRKVVDDIRSNAWRPTTPAASSQRVSHEVGVPAGLRGLAPHRHLRSDVQPEPLGHQDPPADLDEGHEG